MKYFYYDVTDYDYDDEDESNEFEDDGTLDEILQSFYDLSEEDGSFLGLENEQGKIIQFMWNDNNNWLVDIPKIEKEGSLQKHADYDECVALIKKFYGEDIIDISDFTFQTFEDNE
jgi:hypothetical protein